jgi:hypothetical protein
VKSSSLASSKLANTACERSFHLRTNPARLLYRLMAVPFLAALAEAGLQIVSNRSNAHLWRQCEKILRAFLRGVEA